MCRLCSLNQIATGWMVRVVKFDLLLKCCLLNPAVCRFTPLSTFYFPPNWAKFSGMRFFRGIIFFRLNQIPPHSTMSPPGGGGSTFPKKFFASKSFPKVHFFYSFFFVLTMLFREQICGEQLGGIFANNYVVSTPRWKATFEKKKGADKSLS